MTNITRRFHNQCLVLALGLIACSDADDDTETSETSVDSSAQSEGDSDPLMVPDEARNLQTWLAQGHYRAWPAESAVHPSTGPHFGHVRTFVHPELFASLSAGNRDRPHPLGAAAVKELYGEGAEVRGWAVMVKGAAGQTSSGGDAWYWYEMYDDKTYAESYGASLCVGCHQPGFDFWLSPFPLQ